MSSHVCCSLLRLLLLHLLLLRLCLLLLLLLHLLLLRLCLLLLLRLRLHLLLLHPLARRAAARVLPRTPTTLRCWAW